MMSELFDEDVMRMQYERAANRDLREKVACSFAEGEIKGRAELAVEIAERLLRKKSFSLKDISYFTDIPVETLEELSNRCL